VIARSRRTSATGVFSKPHRSTRRPVQAGVGVTLGVSEGEGVAVGVAVCVRVGDSVTEGVAVIVAVAVGVTVGVAVRLGVHVRVGDLVRVSVTVGVGDGEVGVAVGVMVGVATCTTTCAVGPVLPAVSRNATVSKFSPGGKTIVEVTAAQNCHVEVGCKSFGSRDASMIVHGEFTPIYGSNRHAKSTSASVTNWSSGSKRGGSTPGTPPPPCEGGPVSHTLVLPLPKSRLFSIQRSGRPSKPGANEVPSGAPLSPGRPSTTIKN
jgi:hypothetical protein